MLERIVTIITALAAVPSPDLTPWGLSVLMLSMTIISIGGWVWETVYCSLVERRPVPRGFLFGPACPIYGTGAVGFMILFDHPAVASGAFPWWAVFLTAMGLSAVLELTTSIVLEKRFHARWWDYSNLPLNFQGRICVWPAMLFGGGGLAICYLLLPPIKEITLATPLWFWELSSLLVTAVMSADTVLTIDALNDLSAKLEESSQQFDAQMELRVASAHESASNAAAKVTETASNAVAKVTETASSAAAKVTETASNAAAKVTETASNAAAKVSSLPEAAAAKMESFGESIEQAQLEAMEAAEQERERQQALLAETLAEQAAGANPLKPLDNPAGKALDLIALCQAIGVDEVEQVDAQNLKEVRRALKDAVSHTDKLSVIIFKSPCRLIDRSRAAAPTITDCRKCGACIQIGCPALGRDAEGHAQIDVSQCIGCGQCVQVCPFGCIQFADTPKEA